MRLLAWAITFAFLSISTATSAQPGPRGQGPNMAALTEQLGLSDEQAVEVESILTTQRAKRRELMQEARAQGDRAGMREKMGAHRSETEGLLAEVLTEEQMTSYREMAAQFRQRMRQRAGNR